MVKFSIPVLLAMLLALPVTAEDAPIPENVPAEARRAIEETNKMRRTPFFATLNKASECEPIDPVEAERLLKQALELSPSAPIPDAEMICHFQLAQFYFRQKRDNDANKEIQICNGLIMQKIDRQDPQKKLSDIESSTTLFKNAADMHFHNGYREVSEKLLKARIGFVEQLRPKAAAIGGSLVEDGLVLQAWTDLHDYYYLAGRDDLAATIWKKYPTLEARFKRMKESVPRDPPLGDSTVQRH